MCHLIDQLAIERGLKPDDADYIFTRIADYLIDKIPALKQVVNDVFSDEMTEELVQEDIGKTIMLLQQHRMKKFQTWTMPEEIIVRRRGSDHML